LKAGDAFDGPAIIEQDDTTTLLMPGWRAHVDDLGNLVLERKTN
jgi:N-methylhydantoinase A